MLNSKILPSSEPCIYANNRGLRYGDSFTHIIRGNSSKVFLLRRNYDFLVYAMRKLKMQVPTLFKMSVFATDVELLLQKNRIYKGFAAEVTIFRNHSKSKLAEENSVSVLITVEKTDTEWYELNKKGLKASVIKKYYIPQYQIDNSLTPLFSDEYFINSQSEFKNTDVCLLKSENGTILRSIDSLVIFIHEEKIIIPKIISIENLSPFLGFIVSIAGDLGYEIFKADITERDLDAFDEVFIINPEFGIKWILAYKDRRYFHKISLKLTEEINQRLQLYQ